MSKLVHKNLMHYILQSLEVDPSDTFEYDYKARLEELLQQYKIAYFEYLNLLQTDGEQYLSVAIYGQFIGGKLKANFDASTFLPRILDGPISLSPLPDPSKYQRYLWVQLENGTKQLFDTVLFDQMPSNRPLLDDSETNNAENRQIYKELLAAVAVQKLPKQKVATSRDPVLTKVANAIVKQLSNPFYQTVKIRVDFSILDANGQTKDGFSHCNSGNIEDYEVRIKVTLNAQGQLVANSQIQPNYLQEYVPSWQDEANWRGMDLNVGDLRQQVHENLNQAANVEHGIGQRVIRYFEKQFDERIGGYIEAVQATHKVAKNVWAEGAINQNLWHSTGEDAEDYEKWPVYMRQHAIIGGLEDGVIGEIAGIPMALKSIYELAVEPEKRDQMLAMLSREGLSQLYEGMKTEAGELLTDGEKAQHFGGTSTISAAMVLVPGLQVTKVGKLSKIVSRTPYLPNVNLDTKLKSIFKNIEGRKNLINTNSNVLGLLQRLRRNKIDQYKTKVAKYDKDIKQYNKDILSKTEVEIAEIKKPKKPTNHSERLMLYIDEFLELIQPPELLKKLANAPGFEKALEDIVSHWNKFRGGVYVLEYAVHRLKEGKFLKFEVKGDLTNRFYDIQYEGLKNGKMTKFNLELKNWADFYPETIKKQFTKDLLELKPDTTLQWIFNHNPKGNVATMEQLQKQVLAALSDKNGKPIKGLQKAIKDNAINIKNSLGFGLPVNSAQEFIKQLEDINTFKKVFIITKV